jgi:hypothetical protein
MHQVIAKEENGGGHETHYVLRDWYASSHKQKSVLLEFILHYSIWVKVL